MIRLWNYAVCLWLVVVSSVMASDIEEGLDPHRGLVTNHVASYSQYLATKASEGKCSKFSKGIAAGTIGVTSTSFMFFLGRDLTDGLIGFSGPGYVVGAVAQAPVCFIVYDMTVKKVHQIMRNFDPNWKEVRKPSSGFWTGDTVYEVAGHAVSLLPGMVAMYYTNLYWRPLIQGGVWLVFVPTAVGQCIMGQGALDALNRFVTGFFQNFVFKSCLAESTATRLRVEGLIDQLIAEVKGLSPEDIDDALSLIRSSQLGSFLHQPRSVDETCCQKATKSSLGISGSIIGMAGSYAMIAGTKIGVKWLLASGFGVDSDTADTIGTVTGYMGGFIVGAIRGLGSRSTFQTMYGYFSSCCRRGGGALSKKQFVTDASAGALSLVASSSRIKIILDTNIENEAAKLLVIIASIMATSSTDFYGLKGVLDQVFHGAAGKQSLIQLLTGLKSDLTYLKPSLVAELEAALRSKLSRSQMQLPNASDEEFDGIN